MGRSNTFAQLVAQFASSSTRCGESQRTAADDNRWASSGEWADSPAPALSDFDDCSVPVDDESELGILLHRLNNQLSIILANAELLEKKLDDDAGRSRASQIVASVVDAIGTARDIRSRAGSTSE